MRREFESKIREICDKHDLNSVGLVLGCIVANFLKQTLANIGNIRNKCIFVANRASFTVEYRRTLPPCIFASVRIALSKAGGQDRRHDFRHLALLLLARRDGVRVELLGRRERAGPDLGVGRR